MACTVLFYSKFKHDSHEPVQVVWTPETGTWEVGTNVTGKAGFSSKAKGSHDLIACRYFSFTSRAIVETNDMISRYDPVLSLSGIRSMFLIVKHSRSVRVLVI